MIRLPPILRPRWTWRCILGATVATYLIYCFLFASPLFSSRLPSYTGPYAVGAIDLEAPVVEPRRAHDARFRENDQPAFQVSGLDDGGFGNGGSWTVLLNHAIHFYIGRNGSVHSILSLDSGDRVREATPSLGAPTPWDCRSRVREVRAHQQHRDRLAFHIWALGTRRENRDSRAG